MKLITGIVKKNLTKKFKILNYIIKNKLSKYPIIKKYKILYYIYDYRNEIKYNDIILFNRNIYNLIITFLK